MGQVDPNDPADPSAFRTRTTSKRCGLIPSLTNTTASANSGDVHRATAAIGCAIINTQPTATVSSQPPAERRSGRTVPEAYGYNVHGSMTPMPHLPSWHGIPERMQASSTQAFNDGTPETTYYVYDACRSAGTQSDGRQADRPVPTRMKERNYLGGFEIYREYDANGTNVALERETLHVMDDKQRIALVETKT